MKNRLCFCVLFLALLVSAPLSFGQSAEANSLRGLQGIFVLAESLTPEGRRTGLTLEQIETDVELQLRKVGIRIDKSADEYLYVKASVMEVEERGFVYHLEVSVKQKVTLARDPSILTGGTT